MNDPKIAQGDRLNRNPDNIIFTITKSKQRSALRRFTANPAFECPKDTRNTGYYFSLGSEGLESVNRQSCCRTITKKLVEADGIEPTTSGLQSRRSPN